MGGGRRVGAHARTTNRRARWPSFNRVVLPGGRRRPPGGRLRAEQERSAAGAPPPSRTNTAGTQWGRAARGTATANPGASWRGTRRAPARPPATLGPVAPSGAPAPRDCTRRPSGPSSNLPLRTRRSDGQVQGARSPGHLMECCSHQANDWALVGDSDLRCNQCSSVVSFTWQGVTAVHYEDDGTVSILLGTRRRPQRPAVR